MLFYKKMLRYFSLTPTFIIEPICFQFVIKPDYKNGNSTLGRVPVFAGRVLFALRRVFFGLKNLFFAEK